MQQSTAYLRPIILWLHIKWERNLTKHFDIFFLSFGSEIEREEKNTWRCHLKEVCLDIENLFQNCSLHIPMELVSVGVPEEYKS